MTLKEIQMIAGTMRKSATNLFRLLENLLEWSRMQQGLIPFHPDQVLLLPFINENLKTALELAKNKEIQINCIIPNQLEVFADSNMLHAVVRNVVSNAIKFTPKGGEITLDAKPIAKNFIEISILYTGIGMSHDMINKLFKLDENTNRKGTEGEPSSGLGLIICKDFVEKNGRNLRIDSVEGK